MNQLYVWRDVYSGFELVGSLFAAEGKTTFCYDNSYRGPAISVCLPVKKGAFSARETQAFFSALSPEGPMRADFLRMLRAARDEYVPFLEALNDESIGALVFSTGLEEPGLAASYVYIDPGFFELLADSPQKTAVETLGKTRLSLTGAMAKVGLYRNAETGCWYLPIGSAPSTHIVKTGSSAYPLEVVNEAICMKAARLCGFEVPDVELIAVPEGKQLLAVERYDRVPVESPVMVGDLPKPLRLHQEDFCQACSLPSSLKYEPTDGSYLNLVTSRASRYCSNGFGESQLLLSYVLFDYLVGNCDNHLKNYSLLYDSSWLDLRVAPLYDVLNTTIYRSLSTEMGVSFGGSRSIYGLDRASVEHAIREAHLPVKIGMSEFDAIAETLPDAIRNVCAELSDESTPGIDELAELLLDGVEKRRSFDFRADNVRTF